MIKKVLSMVLACLMVFSIGASMVACSESSDKKGESASPLAAPELKVDFTVKDDFKMGFIFLHDENSTYDKNFINAVDAVKKALNLKDEQVIKKTNIPESVACYDAAVELVKAGCKMIFADSFGHESFMIQAAKEYPEVQFCHATGTRAHTEGVANYHNAFASIYEGRYLAGIVAGMKINEMIKNGTEINGIKVTAETATIGYVGAFTYAEVISGMTSFYLGAKSVCPTVTMKVQYTGAWYDTSLEQEAAEALMSKGCILISQHADSMGAPSACEQKGVPNVSYNGSTYSACPDTFMISSAINWAPYMLYVAKCVNTGATIDTDWCGGIAEGSVVLSGINLDVAAEGTEKAIKDAVASFKAGTLHVFDVTKDNYITVKGEKLTSYMADVNTDENFTADTEVVKDGYFAESEFRSAPYFDLIIDGIDNMNSKY